MFYAASFIPSVLFVRFIRSAYKKKNVFFIDLSKNLENVLTFLMFVRLHLGIWRTCQPTNCEKFTSFFFVGCRDQKTWDSD